MPDEPPAGGEAAAATPTESGPAGSTPAGIEAPEALFGLDIGDSEVEFFLEGVWRASLLGSIGVLIGPDGTQISPFPGLDTGRVFQQMPDLTFSVWLMNQFFIEASVIGDFLEQDYEYFDQNYILMGYMGEEDDFLQRLLIGSRDVSIDPFPFIDVPEPGASSLGVEAVLGTGMSGHQLLLRYDNNEQNSLTYIGSNLVSEQVIALDEYVRGRFFKLPDEDIDAGTLDVYIEDSAGSFSDADGRKYRKATVDDAVLDRENGTVFLKEAAVGSVLAYYEIGGSPVGQTVGSQGDGAFPGVSGLELDLSGSNDFDWGQSFLDEPMSERQVTIGSDTCLLLYRPGEFSPFEILAGYALEGTPPEDLSRLRVWIVRKGSFNTRISPDTAEVSFSLTPGQDYIQAFYQPAPGLRDDFRNLYPFLDDANPAPPFDEDNLLYGPLADAKPGYLDYEILVSNLTPVSAYQIGSDIVPGSVQILRNGIAETRFEVDYESGVITFLTEIAPDDRLVVSFRRQSSLTNNGDILFAWGNTLNISEAMELQLAAGLRWNFLPGSYAEEAYSRTGTVIVSAGVDGMIGPLSYNASIGAAYTNPDTTGLMRLLGMESTGMEVPLSENTAYPAAPPVDDTPFTTAPSGVPEGNRGRLLYKDYRSYGFAGTSALQDFSFTPPAEQVFPYATGSKPGPYLVAEANPTLGTSRSLVLDFELDAGDWVGVQLSVLSDQGLSDLSKLEAVAVSYRARDISGSGTFDLYLQIGDISEDLDPGEPLPDHLDEELTANAAGFTFNDVANGPLLRVGSGPKNTGNGQLDTEDVDGNGFLDADEGDMVTIQLDEPTLSWIEDIESFDATEKSQLRRVRSLRLVVVETSGSASAAAKLLIDRISLIGTGFALDDSSFSGTVDVREIEEWQSSAAPPEELDEEYLVVDEVFHPFGETQKIVEIEWSGGAAGDSWVVKGYTEAQTEGIQYRNIVYYYRNPAANGAMLEFSLLDEEDRGIRWEFPSFTSDAWTEIRVSLDDEKVYRDGTEIAGSDVTMNDSGRSLSIFTVKLTEADSLGTPRTLYLDELHMTDPAGSLGAGVDLELELDLPGELVTWGAHPLIHDLSFRQQAAYVSRGFSTLYGTPSDAHSYSSVSELDLGISVADVNADLTVAGTISDTERLVTLAGGHGLTVPNVSSPVVFSDSFSLRERDTGRELQRENTFILNAPPLVRLGLGSRAGSLEETLSQSWDADLRITPAPFSLQNSLSISGAVDDFFLSSDGYFPNWIYGYALLFPYQKLTGWDSQRWPAATEVERQADLNLDWVLDTAPVGLRTIWRHGFHSYDFVSTDRTLRSSADMELSVPVRWQDSGASLFSIISGYRRHLEVVDPAAGTGDYSDDFYHSFQTIYAQRYLWSRFPFVELYSRGSEQLFLDLSEQLDSADYSAEVYMQLSRRFSSRIRDLFLPSFLELRVEKRFVKDEDLTDLYNSYTLTARSTALNLFGDYGAYPVFPFYRTDEFSTALSLIAEVDEPISGIPLRGLEMNLDHFISLEGKGDEQLTFRNRLSLRQEREQIGPEILWGDSAKLLYLWSRHPERGVRLPLLPEKVRQQGYWTHQESLGLEMTGPGEESSFHPLNLIVGHESTAVLPDYGEIRAEVSAGVDMEKTDAGQRYWRLGLSGGISVQIEF